MGSSPSKKKNKKVSNMVTASFAFEDACIRAAEKRKPNGSQRRTVTTGHEEKRNRVNGYVKPIGDFETRDDAMDTDDEDDLARSDASTKIQSAFRGYQERKQRKLETEMAIKIQRLYRRHCAVQKALSEGKLGQVAPETATLAVLRQLAPATEKHKTHSTKTPEKSKSHSCPSTKEDTPRNVQIDEHLVGVGEKTREVFISFQDEITALKWNAEQQLERALCGADFVGPRIVLVSSKVPKGEMLFKMIEENVLIFHYDFDKDTFEVLIDNIGVNLQAFKHGCKARSICIYCQGGPGFLYLRKSKVVTVAKLQKEGEQDQVRFFKELGNLITKLEPHKSVIHIMGCNVMGNEKGQKLFDNLQDLMKPNQVRFEAPLELAPDGVEMIKTYFDFKKYTDWRRHKHSKTD